MFLEFELNQQIIYDRLCEAKTSHLSSAQLPLAMNNETVESALLIHIQTVYEQTVQRQVFIASFALLVYTSLLHFGDEVQYIWKWEKKFSLPNILFALSKYPILLYEIILIVQTFVQTTANGDSLVYDIYDTSDPRDLWSVFPVRYREKHTNHMPMQVSTIPVCKLNESSKRTERMTSIVLNSTRNAVVFRLVRNVTLILSDLLAFTGVIYKTFKLWKLKKSAGLKSNCGEELTTSLLRHGTIRFSLFVNVSAGSSGNLSALLICELTIDLRRRNAERKNSGGFLSHQTSSTQTWSIASRLHEHIVTEFGDMNDLVDITSSPH
ncbi:hypothetical protein Clacol_000308 [Clathrus columnatus]|uniref:DUF6533 domain-containing protein n=1 Tax=Clathrus columnatus TaxID=1419009 RepID=A0AAV4ZWF0_9AGAM|nr:hypothetical protein Clacol_000308 [Clathrus columnatus]